MTGETGENGIHCGVTGRTGETGVAISIEGWTGETDDTSATGMLNPPLIKTRPKTASRVR